MSQSTHGGKETAPSTERRGEKDYDWLFAEPRCRMALDTLDEVTTPVELAVLAKAITVRESDSDAVDEAAIEEVAISLHHEHLPKMDRLGVIDYDAGANRVEEYQ